MVHNMADPSLMGEIRRGINGHFESCRKLFGIAGRLVVIAEELKRDDGQHHDQLKDLAALTNELIEAGKEVSDNAQIIGKGFSNIISTK